jgi:FlaA1/EpsC-like NDP-sugar epimerase
VVHAFTAQIQRGGPITVTHPEVERFFMLIPEACQLVLEAASIGADGEVMVLDMGHQVKIIEVARTLISLSGRKDIDIVYTGLRPGEKIGEELFSDSEQRIATRHRLVSRVDVPVLAGASIRDLSFAAHDDAAHWMRQESVAASVTSRLARSRTGSE